MKVVILAGGFGTRISEESHLKPKPMIEVGEQPMLWHIMKCYSAYGFNDFIICCGYKAHVIKDYFANYYLYRSDITYDFGNSNKITIHNNVAEHWRVSVIDTGLNTMTGGRLKRISEFIEDKPFMMTYGDGISDIDPRKLLEFHKSQGKLATLTAIQPGGRFGTLEIGQEHIVHHFAEKQKEDGGWINGGFMVLQPEVLDYIEDDKTVFEKGPLVKLSNEGQLCAYKYDGFWACMDTLRDKLYLEDLLQNNNAPWKVWT